MTEAIINLQALLVKSYLLKRPIDEHKRLSHWIPRRAGLASGLPLLGATLTQSAAIVGCGNAVAPVARALGQVNLNNRTNLGAGRIGS